MLVSYIHRGIEVCIQAVPTRATEEQTLRTSIVTSLMPTLATRLRRVTWVNLLDTDTALLPFVGNIAVQLGKRPPVQLALVVNVLVVFAASHLGRFSDVGEIFQDNRCTSRGTGDNLLTQNVITVLVETRLLATQFLEVTLCGFSSFDLQFTFESEGAAVNFFPSLASKKLFVRGDQGG